MTAIRQVVSILAVWGAASAFGLAFAEYTRVGPVLLTLSRSHGVHVGDLVALLASYAVAAVLTRHVLRQPVRRSGGSGPRSAR
jgi:hypothetical protein